MFGVLGIYNFDTGTEKCTYLQSVTFYRKCDASKKIPYHYPALEI